MRVAPPLHRIIMTAVLGLLLTGCASMERRGADVGLRFMEHHFVAPALTEDDIDMACINGQAFAPILYALGPAGLKADTDQLSALLYATAAVCAEENALDNELRYMRATRSNHAEEAVDARITQLRWLELASRRQYRAYLSFNHYYTSKYHIELGEGCPKFDSEFDEMVFLLGTVSGLQAIVNDVNSENAVNVPKDIAGRGGRALMCLDNEKWWGVPMAVEGAIWNFMPGGGPADPWVTMKNSMEIGRRKGVRAAYVIYAMSAFAKDDEPRMLEAFKAYAATRDDPGFVPSVKYRAFDVFSDKLMTSIEDRYWTMKTGSRIPANEKCFCNSATPAVPSINIDDL